MNLAKEFSAFWESNGWKYSIKDKERWLANCLKEMRAYSDNESYDTDFIFSKQKGKEKKRRILLDFYQYMSEKTGEKIDSDLSSVRFYDTVVERQLEIARILHTPKTVAQIADELSIDEQTVRKDLKQLDDGVELLGATIQLTKEKKGTKYYYQSTVHPVFLPLNLTEVHALTDVIKRAIGSHHPSRPVLEYLEKRIESQLTDYATDRLELRRQEDYSNDYYSDEEFLADRYTAISYMMKPGVMFKFFHGDEEFLGHVVYGMNNKCVVVSEDGREFAIEEVEWLPEPVWSDRK